MDDDARTTELDEILGRAVERQIAEQRALRQSLDELRDSVRELASRPRLDLGPLEERLDTIHRTARDLSRDVADRPTAPPIDAIGLEDRLRTAIQSGVLGASETTVSSLSEQIRSLREAMVPRLEQAAEANATVRTMAEDITSVRDVVGGVSSDIEGIAQALIDFNSGLRSWASGIDDSISSIRLTVGELYSVATQPAPSPPAEAETAVTTPVEAEAKARPERPAREPAPEQDSGAIEERIRETAELSEYLADQIEDLDGVMGRLSELPQQLEGVVSQALKRTLTARAKLDREAESALDDLLEALDEHVGQLTGILQRFEQEEDHIRKLALEQVELTSRVESLQATFIDRLERVDAERRHGEEALAVALDRSARGLAPRALESLSKGTRRRRASTDGHVPRGKAAKRKTAKTSKAKPAKKSKEPARKQSRRKAKRTARKSAPRREWTPLPELNDETPA